MQHGIKAIENSSIFSLIPEAILPILLNRNNRYNQHNSYFYIFFQIRYRKIPILKKPKKKGQKLFVNDFCSIRRRMRQERNKNLFGQWV